LALSVVAPRQAVDVLVLPSVIPCALRVHPAWPDISAAQRSYSGLVVTLIRDYWRLAANSYRLVTRRKLVPLLLCGSSPVLNAL